VHISSVSLLLDCIPCSSEIETYVSPWRSAGASHPDDNILPSDRRFPWDSLEAAATAAVVVGVPLRCRGNSWHSFPEPGRRRGHRRVVDVRKWGLPRGSPQMTRRHSYMKIYPGMKFFIQLIFHNTYSLKLCRIVYIERLMYLNRYFRCPFCFPPLNTTICRQCIISLSHLYLSLFPITSYKVTWTH